MNNYTNSHHGIDSDGHESWIDQNDCYCNREDGGPTVIYADGSEEWRKNGYLNRENNPTFISSFGYEYWFNSKLE